ncbi:hypothetical protein APHAL10511_004483 [Amanita phalloides]|nr:hypothetical protein APHAL10511_004483 [Amanita phalloides]
MAREDEDQRSLFGSPGPSRSPSPALGLPGAPDGIAQNVGTIALPGSQHYSELPKDPLALSLQYPVPRRVIHPAAPPLTANSPSSSASTPSARSRASSVVPPATRPRKRKRKKKEAQLSPAPAITPPDPSAPLPPNFLRNHMALLGTAGLVAGIKPANLSMPLTASRGSTPANPIVIEDEGYTSVKMKPNFSKTTTISGGVRYDEHDAPRLGKRSDSMTPSLEIDPELLPAPTNKEIVAMLVGQKDIFPVLQGILRLVAGQKAEQLAAANASPTPAPPSKRRSKRRSEHQTPTPPTGLKAPPLKRRRLNRVPAGAADWDVPYPFQEGEGPEEYRQTWEKERGKQLVSQLVNLIRIAARKAATKKYLQQEARHKAVPKAGRTVESQRSHSAPAALKQAGQLGSVIGDASVLSTQIEQSFLPLEQPEAPTAVTGSPDFASPLATPSESIPETSLDQLISSLLAASFPTNAQGGDICGTGAGAAFDPSTVFVNSISGEDVNDGLIDSWMNVFETFPIPSDGFASDLDTSFQEQQRALGASNFDLFNMASTLDFGLTTPLLSLESISTSTTVTSTVPFPQLFPENALQEDAEQFLRDIGLEPIPTCHSTQYHSTDDIMNDPPSALSQSQPRPLVDMDKFNDFTQSNPTSDETSGAPALSAPSPIPSASSASSVGDPSTPTSALWESGTLDIVFAQHNQDPSSSQGERQQQHDDDEGSETRRFTAQEKGKWKGNGKDRENPGLDQDADAERAPATAPPDVPPSLETSTLGSQSDPFPTVLSRSTSPPGQKKLNKQEIIHRAQERRRQLVEELERVKMQLWETTIEQSVLVELQKEALP